MGLDQSGVLTVGSLVPKEGRHTLLVIPPRVGSHRSSLAHQGHHIRAVPMQHMVNKAQTCWVAAIKISGHLAFFFFFKPCQHLQGSCGSVLCYNLKVGGCQWLNAATHGLNLPHMGFLGPPVGCCGYVWLIIEFLSSRVFSMYTDHIPPEPGSEVCTGTT